LKINVSNAERHGTIISVDRKEQLLTHQRRGPKPAGERSEDGERNYHEEH
jgi:hypothetical protein